MGNTIANSFCDCNSYLLVRSIAKDLYHLNMRGETKQKRRAARLRLLHDSYSWIEIASRCPGIDPTYLSQIANEVIQKGGKTPRMLSDDYCDKIEHGMKLPLGWFDQEITFPISNVEISDKGFRLVPVISYVQAGQLTEVIDPFSFGSSDESITTTVPVSENTYALRIKGDSMLPEFKEGDIVIIDPEIAPEAGDYVVAKNGKEEATFKKYRPRGEYFELIPLNEQHETLRSDLIAIQIIGTMVEHRRFRRRGT